MLTLNIKIQSVDGKIKLDAECDGTKATQSEQVMALFIRNLIQSNFEKAAMDIERDGGNSGFRSVIEEGE